MATILLFKEDFDHKMASGISDTKFWKISALEMIVTNCASNASVLTNTSESSLGKRPKPLRHHWISPVMSWAAEPLFKNGKTESFLHLPIENCCYSSMRDFMFSTMSHISLSSTKGSVKAFSTIPARSFSLFLAREITSSMCLCTFEKLSPYSPMASVVVKIGKKNCSPFCRISGIILVAPTVLNSFPINSVGSASGSSVSF